MIIFGQISLEINHFCADQTSVFNIFLTEVRHYFAVSTTICSRNEPMAKPLTSWLKPSFSQHNLCLVVLGRCLHVSVTTFQDKFASLRQVNSPNSWDKFKNCRTDMYLIRFLPNFMVFYVFLWISWHFTDLPEFCASTTMQNIRRADICTCTGSLVSLKNDVWGTSTNIQLLNNVSLPWVVFSIGWSKFHMQHDQSEVLSRTGYWHIISKEIFLQIPSETVCQWGVGEHGNICSKVKLFLTIWWQQIIVIRNNYK